MPTLIIGIADPHFSDKKPRSRKDDFLETQRRKLKDVIKLAASIKWDNRNITASALLIAGDAFHQPKGKLISRKLDHRLMQLLRDAVCPICCIAGNHDLDRDRLESLEEHPLGTLVASGLVKLTHWPDYQVVGNDPPIIITGRQYTIDGPAAWLDHLTTTGKLRDLKKRISDETGKRAQAIVMTHNYWAPSDGDMHGDPVVGHHRARGVGAEVILYGHPHCASDYTWVETLEGGLQRFSEIVPKVIASVRKKLTVPTDEGLQKTTHVHNFGSYPMLRITTRRGFTLEAVPHHKVRVLKRVYEPKKLGGKGLTWKYEWKRMDELREGDKLALKLGTVFPKENPIIPWKWNGRIVDLVRQVPIPERLNGDWAEYLGWVAAEGNLNRETSKQVGQVELHAGNEAERERIKDLMKKCGIPLSMERFQHGAWDLRTNSRQFAAWLRYIGVGHAETKQVPWPVLQGTEEINRRFLQGYFGGDASIGKYNPVLEVSTVSEVMADQIQQMLRRVGILSSKIWRDRKAQISPRTGKLIKAKRQWRVYTSTVDYQEEKRLLVGVTEKDTRWDTHQYKTFEWEIPGKGRDLRYKEDIVPLTIKKIESTVAVACDITQPATETYISNGFVSHNTYDGAIEVEDEEGPVSVVGPGALIRGTLAETDVKRKPMIMVSAHNPDGTYQIVLAQIPHEKAEEVFDLEKHERVKKEKAVQERFIYELTKLQSQTKKPEDYFDAAIAKFPGRVVSRAKQYYLAAEGELAQG